MGIANRHSATRGLLATFSLGLGCAAGCAETQKPVAVAPPKVEPTPGVAAPSGADDASSRVVVDSVNDNVARVDAILRRRAEAQQLADDVRAQREAREGVAKPPAAPTTRATDGAADEDEIERLAAEIRAIRTRGTATPAAAVDPADVSAAIATPTQIEMKRAAAQPAAAVAVATSADPLAALDREFVGKVASDPTSLDAQLGLQLVRFLRNEAVPTATDLAPLPADDREILSSVCDALSNFRSVVRASPNPMSVEKSRPFVEMADRIRARADLKIASMALCTVVRKFGDYDPIEPLRIVTGGVGPAKAVFYCEVDGFTSTFNAKQKWETRLSLSLKLFDANAVEVWGEQPVTVPDQSSRRRHDFFLGKIVQLPSSLAPGRYLMKATVRDLQGNRVDESTLQVDLVAK